MVRGEVVDKKAVFPEPRPAQGDELLEAAGARGLIAFSFISGSFDSEKILAVPVAPR